jgi:hypothetical protein
MHLAERVEGNQLGVGQILLQLAKTTSVQDLLTEMRTIKIKN